MGEEEKLALEEISAPAPPSEGEEDGLDTTLEEIQLEGEARTAEPTALELEEMCSKEPQGETKAKVKGRKSKTKEKGKKEEKNKESLVPKEVNQEAKSQASADGKEETQQK